MSNDVTKLEALIRRVADSQKAHDAAPENDLARREALREAVLEARAELRRMDRKLFPDPDDAMLRLAHLEQRYDEIMRTSRIDVVSQSGGGSSGGDFGFAAGAWELNQKIDAAHGIHELEAEIRALREHVEELRGR